MTAPIRVLIIDDSAFVRKVVREMLNGATGLEVVGVARDGEEGLRQVAELHPDVATCDLTMPTMDGVNFVRRQLAVAPLPILILTASPQDAPLVVEALAAGAVDFMQKPSALATEELRAIRAELTQKIRALARTHPGQMQPSGGLHPAIYTPRVVKVDLVAIGISTGGPQALRVLLPQFPADFPVPIAVVLHMPIGYTAAFAEKLNQLSAMEVVEAKEGEVMRPGLIVLAQAGRHLTFRRNSRGAVVVQMPMLPIEKPHRPSVDVMFESAADVYRDKVLGVVMTGMGDDGKQGAAWIKSQGGTVLTESEDSCVIYGMPRSVVEAGLSDASVPLDKMAQQIIERL
jgi:two-component system chemotaxis response regulator CheB